MIKLLIIYTSMVVGGSTTSLLSLFNSIDYSKYEVDLLLLKNGGELQHLVNKNVHLLEFDTGCSRLKRYFSPRALKNQVVGTYLSKKRKNRLVKAQMCSGDLARAQKKLDLKYDTAISFLEFWPYEFLANNVDATKKIAWIHINPYEARLIPKYSKKALAQMDNIILVSESCKTNFDTMFPEFANKSVVIENILDAKIIRSLAEEKCDLVVNHEKINFVSVCRINLASKGLDRVITAFNKLRDENPAANDKLEWYIIGDGPDKEYLEKIIADNNYHNIHMLGSKINPYRYEKQMDYFLLPSRYEGKPMAVTEAQMLGLVPIVTNYSSACEQIADSADGLIAKNDDYDIYNYIKAIIDNKVSKDILIDNLRKKDFSNDETIRKINILLGL